MRDIPQNTPSRYIGSTRSGPRVDFYCAGIASGRRDRGALSWAKWRAAVRDGLRSRYPTGDDLLRSPVPGGSGELVRA